MNDEHLLIRAVLADPAEDTSRLVYADWLDERGGAADAARAGFIRVQCELAKLAPYVMGRVCGTIPGPVPDPDVVRHATLGVREQELWDAVAAARPRDPIPFVGIRPAYRPESHCQPHGLYRRGFVSDVSLTLDAFLELAPLVFAAHPVVGVTLTDRVPHHNGRGLAWFRAGRARPSAPETADLPPCLFERLEGGTPSTPSPFPPRWLSYGRHAEEAREALNRACVAYGRELVGLPPLKEALPGSSAGA